MRRFELAAVVCALCLGSRLHAEPQQKPSDYQVKAAYLFNFGRFATWPETAEGGVFNVCVLGRDPFGPVLDTMLGGETINGLSAAVRRIALPPETAGCRILFVSGSEESQLPAILHATEDTGALTVSDMPQFLDHGGMIQFVSQGNRIRFEVNLTAVEHANLVLSSELLKVAAAVRRNVRAGD